MIEPPPLRRRSELVLHSQLALEVALSAYAIVAAALTLRVAFLAVGMSDRIWAGAVLYWLTKPVVWPLTVLPGGRRDVLGDVSLPDLTAVGLVLLVPLVLLARTHQR